MQTHIQPKFTALLFLSLFLIFNLPAVSQEIWGMTKYGGDDDKGVIFKMDENATTQEVVFSFETVQYPEGGLTEYREGIFYGLSRWGGKHDMGVIYKFELENGKFTSVIDLDGAARGSGGRDRMIYASSGKMYGTTVYGGLHDNGILFEFDPQTESFTKLFDFDGMEYGARPEGCLLEGDDGKLYGTTASGGTNDDGILFSFDIATKEFTKIIDFEAMVSGAVPLGSLIQLSDGIIYGMTTRGGPYDDGLIFSYTPDSIHFAVLVEFDETITGKNPIAGLVTAPNGKVYGITPKQGPDDVGFLFEYIPQTNSFSKKVEFLALSEAGWSCVAASNGNLYWVPDPGLHVPPNVMGYDPETDNLMMGVMASVGSREPALFFNSLIQSSNGKLYFIANATQNDIRNENTLYEYDTEVDEFTNYYKFSGIETGEFPYGSLHQGANGMLYGTTFSGGAYHQGVIFKIDPENYNFTKLLDFERETNGAKPKSGMILAHNQKFYGMTSEGGAFDKGVIYELDPVSESFIKIFDFNGFNGEHPDGELVEATNGLLYGVTVKGGAYENGVLFEFNPEIGSFTKLIDFDGTQLGKEPNSYALVAATDGKVYGTTLLGGISEEGVLFEYDPATAGFKKVIDFQQEVTGKVPVNMIQGNDGMLFSHVAPGFIVKIDASNSQITKVLDDCYLFNPLSGRLMQAANGKFFGMDRGLIWYRATDFTGSIHEFDIEGGSYSPLMEFSWSNGSNPENTSLIQLKSFAAPVVECKNITLYLDEAGKATLLPADINNGSTEEGIELTVSKSNFTCEDSGENSVTLTARDENGNTVSCTAVVTVSDTIVPVALCRNVDVFLDASGTAVIDAADIDSGSSDACGVKSLTLDRNSFDCQSIGENIVELFVTDSNGNISSCHSTVMVNDTLAPEVVCRDIEIVLGEAGVAEILAADIDNGSQDACGIESMALNKASFSCESIGENEIELTVIDNNGNSAVCTAFVTVTDNSPPVVSCVSGIEEYLEPQQESYMITNALWDADASDDCRIESLEYTINADTNLKGTSLEGIAMEAGVHVVEWLVADAGGNFSSCTSVITIEKRPVTLQIVKEEVDREQGKIHVEAVLMDELLGEGIKNKLLVFAVDENNESAVTDESGLARVDVFVEDAARDNYTISVRFDEDITYTGAGAESEIITGSELVPFASVKVYPNPFINKLYFEFTALESADARIDLVDPTGRLVDNIFNQPVKAGSFYKTEYIPSQLKGSFLLYRMKIGTTVFNGKILNGR